MLEFTSKHGPFRIKGRGFVIPVNESLPEGMWNPDDLTGMEVLIDGKKYKVLGVEKFAIGYSENNPYRLSLGILVGNIF